MNRSLKIFLACALGAFVGSLVALQFNEYLWWVGLAAGGLVGYLAFEFHNIVKVVQMAWRVTFGVLGNRERRQAWAVHFLCTASVALSFMTFGELLSLLTHGLNSKSQAMYLHDTLWPWWTLLLLVYCAAVGVLGVTRGGLNSRTSMQIAIHGNPIAVYIYYPFRLLWLAVRGIPRLVRWLTQIPAKVGSLVRRMAGFVRLVFVQVHSDIRLLCAVDAAIGTGVGYYFENAIVGALFGGLFGVLNYQLISKRLLRFGSKSANA